MLSLSVMRTLKLEMYWSDRLPYPSTRAITPQSTTLFKFIPLFPPLYLTKTKYNRFAVFKSLGTATMTHSKFSRLCTPKLFLSNVYKMGRQLQFAEPQTQLSATLVSHPPNPRIIHTKHLRAPSHEIPLSMHNLFCPCGIYATVYRDWCSIA